MNTCSLQAGLYQDETAIGSEQYAAQFSVPGALRRSLQNCLHFGADGNMSVRETIYVVGISSRVRGEMEETADVVVLVEKS